MRSMGKVGAENQVNCVDPGALRNCVNRVSKGARIAYGKMSVSPPKTVPGLGRTHTAMWRQKMRSRRVIRVSYYTSATNSALLA